MKKERLKVLKYEGGPRTSPAIQKQRLDKSAQILEFLDKNPGAEDLIWFSDESPFTCGPAANVPQNDRFVVSASTKKTDVNPRLLVKEKKIAPDDCRDRLRYIGVRWRLAHQLVLRTAENSRNFEVLHRYHVRDPLLSAD